MLIRRCAVLFFEPREELAVDLAALFSGAGTLAASLEWIALAPHLDRELALTNEQVAVLGAIGQTLWQERAACEQRFGVDAIAALLDLGLLVADGGGSIDTFRARDELLRAQQWQPLAAVAHTFRRWQAMTVESGMQFPTFEQLVASYGVPPAPTWEPPAPGGVVPDLASVTLPAPRCGALDATLLRRYTGRNFDAQAVLPLAVAARLLQRTFGAQGQRDMAPDAPVLKKTSPSAGGLHPVEAYVLVQRVDGVAPGLYHYHPLRHSLDPLAALTAEQARALAVRATADQDWFADAPLLVFMAARVFRNFWKYRNHAKAQRAMLLDAGHLSQTFYLLAAEAGLPAFITAAINEKDIEQALGLDPLEHDVIAVCGCGAASGAQQMPELRIGELD